MRRWPLLLALLALTACGGSSSAPTAVTLTGSWAGTLAMSNYSPPPRVIVTLTQTGNDVSGTWEAKTAAWTGTVSGTVSGSTFRGTISLSASNDQGGRCEGSAIVSGPFDASTTTWTGPGFTGPVCSGYPENLTWTLAR